MTARASVKISAPQIAKIHVLAKQAGLDEDCRRDIIESVSGKRSARDLTSAEAINVIDRLKGASKATDIDGPYGRKIRALWISGWHLGVVQNRTDAAMLAFVERQTGIERTRWLRAASDARKAVEALKQWLAREGGVKWPTSEDALEVRRAVVDAQRRRLTILGFGPAELDIGMLDGAALDREIKAHGYSLRRAIAGRSNG